MKAARPLLVCFVALLAGAFAPGAAASGSLDPGFGADGKVQTPVALGATEQLLVTGVAALPDGATLLATHREVLRYLPDGRLDPGFGQGGAMTLKKVEGLDFEIAGLSVDDSGRILVFGTAADASTTYAVSGYNIGYVHPSYVAVLRFDAAGNPDPSFGANGVARTDLNQPPYLTAGLFPPPSSSWQDAQINPVTAVTGTVDPQGRPLLIAGRYENTATIGHSFFAFEGRLLARFTSSGGLDPEFGEGGVVTLPRSENRHIALGLGDTPVLTWGAPYGGRAQLRAFTESGGFGRGFGRDGLLEPAGGVADVLAEDGGRLLVLQAPRRDCRVTALRPDGSRDRTYGKGGYATLRLRRGSAACGSIALDPNGGAYAAGAPVFTRKGRKPSQRPVVVFGLERSGRPSRAFGQGGSVRTGLGAGTKLAYPQAFVDPQGRLLVAAVASSSPLGPSVFLFRYLLAG
jgi:uncharacterized delta-60 repeat protein